MRIAFSGPANSGKTTLTKQFLANFPMYKMPVDSYRDILKSKKLKHSKETSDETQMIIIDHMIGQLEKYKEEKYILYDRCPLDVLAYTMAGSEMGKISDEYCCEIIKKIHDSLKLLDCIFILPFNENIKIENNGIRETDIEYIKFIDSIFDNIYKQYYSNIEADIFFPANDCPGIIKLEKANQLLQIKTIINSSGDVYSLEDEKENQEFIFNNIMDNEKPIMTRKKTAETALSDLIKANIELIRKDKEEEEKIRKDLEKEGVI